MRPLLVGAVLALLWLLFGVPLVTLTIGVPLATVAATVSALAQPVTIAFAAGALVRPYMVRGKGRTA